MYPSSSKGLVLTIQFEVSCSSSARFSLISAAQYFSAPMLVFTKNRKLEGDKTQVPSSLWLSVSSPNTKDDDGTTAVHAPRPLMLLLLLLSPMLILPPCDDAVVQASVVGFVPSAMSLSIKVLRLSCNSSPAVVSVAACSLEKSLHRKVRLIRPWVISASLAMLCRYRVWQTGFMTTSDPDSSCRVARSRRPSVWLRTRNCRGAPRLTEAIGVLRPISSRSACHPIRCCPSS
mmetsp:Transcript_11772/g.24901  ORF Transcript_11772/g.24901 Transcript_11772/m.24901 type:complete len:232 (+) Transcript_11772:1420-2115(+)